MKKMLQRGFTLIELLVVIAIIGILAAVVLASLNDARSSGSDAAVKQTLGNMRSQAEIYYNKNNFTYDPGAAGAGGGFLCTDTTFRALGDAAAKAGNDSDEIIQVVNTVNGSDTVATCHATPLAWAVQVPLAGAGSWCVDSTGKAMVATAHLLANDVTCN